MLLDTLKKLDLPRASDLPKKQLYQLIIAYVLISLPMMQLFPIWIPALAAVTLSLKLASIRFHFVVSTWITLTILLVCTALVLFNARILGKEYTGIALLFVFASLKILEAREQRDGFLLMLIYLLLIMGALMAQDSPLAFLYLIGCFLYNIYIQLRIAQPPELGLSLKHNLKSIGKILLVSAPFVIILFFFFPRLEPLWKTPGPPQARTGLSDEMTPNSLSELVQDGGMAFRVQFADDRIPTNEQLYWRGPVLTQYDGKTWRRSDYNATVPTVRIDPDSLIDYKIYHDGSTRDWVVPLDIPGKLPDNAVINGQLEMKAKETISKPTAFSLMSYTQYQTGQLSEAERRENTFLPTKLFPQARAFAQKTYRQSQNNEDFANRLWQHFRDTEFYYDLAPPAGNADIDRFLFDNRIGYCQHYASAFVFMLRSQGVPARVVTGYQGGEQNTVSKEFEVRQLNAHAWTEVYLTDKGWVRYDPTAAVSPERVNLGTPFGTALSTDTIAAGARWENQSPLFRQFTSSLRAMNAFWQNWIVDYDADKQNSLWDKLGLGALKYVAWVLLLLGVVPLMLVFWWWYKKRQVARYGDDTYRAIAPFFHYLQRHGLQPAPAQTLRDWLADKNDELGDSLKYADKVIKHYYRLRYGDNHHDGNTADSRALNQAVAQFIAKHHRR